MKEEYQDYIDKLDKDNLMGKCKEISEKMKEEFLELTLVRGHYYCLVWGERCHWWLVDENNEIVDPTALQFPTKGNGIYIPWVEGTEEPTGKCLNCSALVYKEKQFCCESCEEEFRINL